VTRFIAALARRLDIAPDRIAAIPVAGGCISDAFRVTTPNGTLFVKADRPERLPMFEAEASGLEALRDAGALRVPEVVALGQDAEGAFIALEWLDLSPGRAGAEHELGERLAMQHRSTAREFGWHRENWIGATPQHNGWHADWVEFWQTRRLGPQLDLAAAHGARSAVIDRGRRLAELLPAYFASHRPVPSLLHGDLWGGNWAVDGGGRPVLFDPAVYFGDRETDLAMTRLFGGFGTGFYAAYHAAWPLDAAAGYRRDLYNLYHVLNHYNLFGGGYLEQGAGMIDRLLAELGH
jgi:protein-ribulosamine 3-kinase